MMRFLRVTQTLVLLMLTFGPIVVEAADQPDLLVVHRIRHEAFKNSQVMDHLFYMTDVHGPRLTRSPGFQAAAEWAVEQLREWGLEDVHFETWGPFGRGWSTNHFSAHLVEPQYAPLIGVPLAFSPGTDGVISGTPILAPLRSEREFERYEAELEKYFATYKGKLEGKIILIREPPHLEVQEETPAKRFTSSELAERAEAREPVELIDIDFANPKVPTDPYDRDRFYAHAPRYVREKLWHRRNQLLYRLNRFLVEEGVRLVIHPASRGNGGTVFPPRAGRHEVEASDPPPSIALTPEHYNRLARLIEKKIPFRIEVEVKAQFHEDQLEPVNIVAEIPGKGKKNELVVIGAHFDDVVNATGATDNAAGCAVMMEVMRILKSLDLEMDRKVRIVLWSGEEQGLLGSKAYVKQHFGDPETMKLKREHAKVSAYYNLDNGTGKIRGVYLQENDMVRPIFTSWLAPFKDLGATTLSSRNTGGTDHLSFDAVGIPGFQFIQDPVEYQSRTHHSNMDVYDRIQPGDLMQASAIIASFVYHTAIREELLPRKPLPEPWPEEARTR